MENFVIDKEKNLTNWECCSPDDFSLAKEAEEKQQMIYTTRLYEWMTGKGQRWQMGQKLSRASKSRNLIAMIVYVLKRLDTQNCTYIYIISPIFHHLNRFSISTMWYILGQKIRNSQRLYCSLVYVVTST